MNYIEALQALKDSKKIRKNSWDKGKYVYIEDNFIVTDCGDVIDLVVDDLEDITKDKWELYQTEEDKLITDGKRWKLYMCCHNCKSCLHCEGKQEELYRLCTQDGRVTLLNAVKNISDNEVDKLYNAVKGEIDA